MNTQLYGQLIFDKAGKNIQWEIDSVFKKWCCESWTATCKRMKLDHFLIPYKKIKYIKDLNVKPESIKFLEEDTSSNAFDICCSNFFLDTVSSGRGNKSKNKVLGLHQNKKLLHNEGNNQQN